MTRNKILKNKQLRNRLRREIDNMNEIILDGKLMEDSPHEYIKNQLEFPDYYGANLDALYDCLGDLYKKTIIIKNSDLVEEKLLETFKDANEENPDINLILD